MWVIGGCHVSNLGLMLTLRLAWQAVADFESLAMETLSPSLGRRVARSLSAVVRW